MGEAMLLLLFPLPVYHWRSLSARVRKAETSSAFCRQLGLGSTPQIGSLALVKASQLQVRCRIESGAMPHHLHLAPSQNSSLQPLQLLEG